MIGIQNYCLKKMMFEVWKYLIKQNVSLLNIKQRHINW